MKLSVVTSQSMADTVGLTDSYLCGLERWYRCSSRLVTNKMLKNPTRPWGVSMRNNRIRSLDVVLNLIYRTIAKATSNNEAQTILTSKMARDLSPKWHNFRCQAPV